MDLGLTGKSAIVAAASSGLGQAVARALAMEGTSLVMFSRRTDAIEASAREVQAAAAPGTRVIPLAADVTRPTDLERVVDTAVEQFGTVHILYHNSGGPRPGTFDTLTDQDWEQAFELLLLPAIRLTRLCLPTMRRQHWGRVVIGTSVSVKQPLPTLMLSNSLRSAVTAWAKTLSDQVAVDNITVNTLAPGSIDTDRIRQINADSAQRTGRTVDEVERQSLASIPMRRYGTPAEFGAAAAFLASEQAAYITGVTLLVDGGMFRGTY
ncbi:MAG: SDR family oxidoreductase [Chloroflexi bacterium]|nr:SDR family oxidoreductase [Chloroflexota bacterium]